MRSRGPWVSVAVILLSAVAMLEASDDASEVAFKLSRTYLIVVSGAIGEFDRLNFVIDTGAVPSAINARLAKKLRLAGEVTSYSLLNRDVPVRHVTVPSLVLGPIRMQHVPVVAMDLSRIEQATGFRIDAIIGLDVLAQRGLRIDYKRKKISFEPKAPSSAATPVEIHYEAGSAYWLLPVQVDGHTFRVLLDTGTNDIRFFTARVHANISSLATRHTAVTLNAGGEDRLEEVKLSELHIAGTVFRNQRAFLWKTPPDNMRDFDGLLGPTALGVTRVQFDFEQRALVLDWH